VLISINVASFIDEIRISPHIQQEEQSIAKNIVGELLKKAGAANKMPPLEPDWSTRYEQNGKPFTTEDSIPGGFSDML
jgi:hypothetical protein